MNTRIYNFTLSEDGAVTVDWIVLTASVLCSVCVGLMSLSEGVSSVSCSITTAMAGDAEITPGPLGDGETGGGPGSC